MNNLRWYTSTSLSLLAAILLCSQGAYAQSLNVTPGLLPDDMAQTLVGEGVEISNATVSGLPEQYGLFDSDNTELGTTSGILLSTGRAINALGPNDASGLPTLDGTGNCLDCDLYDLGQPGDVDLSILTGGNTWDACVFEFDVQVQGDSLRFDFAFASEEYLEWVGSSFNDVFAFYISGPGITGTQNLAVVPGTATPITINNVNLIDNSEYFYDNQDPLGQYVQYDGFTQGLAAEIGNLIPCETYHLKLAVADGADGLYDSGVFISKIESNPVTILTSTAAGVDYMIEGCNQGTVTLQTTFTPTEDLQVLFTLVGTAELGLDYTLDPDLSAFFDADLGAYVVTVPAGSTTFSFDIFPLADGIIDGGEFVNITLLDQLCDSVQFNSSVDFIIEDTFLVNVTPASADLCYGQCVDFEGTLSDPDFSDFTWIPADDLVDPTSLSQTVCPTDDITYLLRATLGDCIAEDSIVISVDSLDIQLVPLGSTCTDGAFGQVDLTVLDGSGPYTYSWTGPDGFTADTEDITGLEPGEYCVSVVDATGCTGEACATVIITDPLTLESAVLSDFICDEISCAGASDGSIDIAVSGGSGSYTYAWTEPGGFSADTEDVSDLPAGTYTVVVEDENACVVTGSYVLSEPDPLEIELVGQVDVLCTGESTGSATVTSLGGCPPYFYSWSHDPDLNTPVATDLSSALYTVAVTDINGCVSLDQVTVEIGEPTDPLAITTENISVYPGGFNVSCPGATDGSIDVSVAGGIGAYTFTWTDGAGLFVTNTEDLLNAPCGTYTFTVDDENGCSESQTYELTCVPEINITFTSEPNPCGDPAIGLGEIHVTDIFGGHGGPYTETWISGPSCPCAGLDLLNLVSGDYVLEVADAQGCTNQFIINVGTNDVFDVSEAIITDILCAGDSTGSIDVTIDPEGVYSYAWTGPDGFTADTEDIADVFAGDYTLTVTQAVVDATCVEVFNYTVSEPEVIELEFINVVPPVCFGNNNGSLEVQATGGTGDIDLVWLPSADPACFFEGSDDDAISNLWECWYTAQATDANGCVVVDSIFLDAPLIMDIFVSVTDFDGGFNISCNGANDGSISVAVSGGTPDPVTFDPYDYDFDWTDGDDVTVFGNDPNADFVDNLGPGTYSVNVLDANGCLATTTIAISEPDSIEATGSISDYNGFGVSCFGATDGFINPDIAGGSNDYDTYVWSGPDLGTNDPNAENLIGLGAGEYCLTIVDSNGCEEEICFTLTEPDELTAEVVALTDATCYGYCDGTVSIDAMGGAGGYVYFFTDDDGLPFAGNVLTDLCASVYDGTVSDINGCEVDLSFEIMQPDTFVVTLSVPSQSDGPFDLACVGDDNGSILSTVQGGDPDLSYAWADCDGNPLGTDPNIDALEAGCYELVVTDAQGCEATATTDISEPEEPLQASHTESIYPVDFNVSCFGACDGSISTEVVGGVPSYTYLWQLNGSGTVFSEESQLDELCAGTYDILITDSNGCDTTLFIILDAPPPIQPQLVTSNYNGFGVSCNGSCDGTMEIDPSGGQGPIEVEWEDFGDATFIEDLCSGQYLLTLTDSVDCEQITVVTISEPDSLIIDSSFVPILCAGDSSNITLEVTGGVPNYTFDWSPDVSDTNETGTIDAGTYSCTVVDLNGCSESIEETITAPPPIEVSTSITDATCDFCDGVLSTIVSGGTAPSIATWSNGIPDNELSPDSLCPGDYSLTIEDANGCLYLETYTIGAPPAVTANADITDLLCYDTCTGVINSTFNNVQEVPTYTWTNTAGEVIGDGLELLDLCAGEYTVTIEHGPGCQDEFSFTVTQPDSLYIEIELSLYDNGYNVSSYAGQDGDIFTDVQGGTPDYSWEWDGPIEIDDDESYPLDLVAGAYNLLVTDANGCVIDTLIILTQPFDLTLPTGVSPNGDGDNDAYVILGVEEHTENLFQVYNRWGNLVYERSGYQNEWTGQSNSGEQLPDGTYYVVFEADDRQFHTYVDLRR
ncbi:MAG: choice-of-anchor L domain-containing protein [Flavobacteriales bacterium]